MSPPICCNSIVNDIITGRITLDPPVPEDDCQYEFVISLGGTSYQINNGEGNTFNYNGDVNAFIAALRAVYPLSGGGFATTSLYFWVITTSDGTGWTYTEDSGPSQPLNSNLLTCDPSTRCFESGAITFPAPNQDLALWSAYRIEAIENFNGLNSGGNYETVGYQAILQQDVSNLLGPTATLTLTLNLPGERVTVLIENSYLTIQNWESTGPGGAGVDQQIDTLNAIACP